MRSFETGEFDTVNRSGPALQLEIQDDRCMRRIPVDEESITFGSGPGVDVTLEDSYVSARHLSIAVTEQGIRVVDLGSRNGTYVGGARVREAAGAIGTMIVAGRTTFTCQAPGTAEDDEALLVDPLPGVAGASLVMRRVAMQVRRLAHVSAPVLVTGETGVGKELVARALHREGNRHDGPFVALNVAALPRELVESELFGHERGAFTGATSKRDGAFAEADGGTLFLDEIGELPIDAQPKLLRALDGYEIRRIGGQGSGRRADVRVIAATHVPLLEHVDAGRFRRDLFHRLEVFVIELPPLRARPGDIVPISRVVLDELADQIGPRELTPASIAQLTAHDWPGNVRELRNVLLRAAESTPGPMIEVANIVRALRQPVVGAKVLGFTPDRARDWLATHAGNVSKAARAAQMPRSTFRKLLAKTG